MNDMFGKERRKEIFFWPVLWYRLMKDVSTFAKEGRVHATEMVRQVNANLKVANIMVLLICFASLCVPVWVRILAIIVAYIMGIPLRWRLYNKVVSRKTWVGEIAQGLLFGLIWGCIFSVPISILWGLIS